LRDHALAYLKVPEHWHPVRKDGGMPEDYENQIRTNIAFAGAEEILLFLQHAGQADLNQIRAACLGGKKSGNQIQNHLYRLTRCTPSRVKATLLAQEPNSPVMTVLYSLCSDDA